jgi:lipid A 3-O-deacylase
MKYTFILILISYAAWGQMIDNTSTYRNISSDRYLRLNYENDFFSTTDIYYTQGINLEFVHPALKKFPANPLLFKLKNQQAKFGIAAEHLGFTPTSISHSEVLRGDRPFAACLLLKAYSISNDSKKGERLCSLISVGVIGPGAGGKEFQSAIHRWINDTQPLGWNNQIANDLVLNYEINFEKQFFSVDDYLLTSMKGGAKAGTLTDKIYCGMSLQTGRFDNAFRYFSIPSLKKVTLQVYFEPQFHFIAFDATLQGGLLHRKSSYTIPAKDVDRIVFQYHSGLTLRIRKFSMEYFQSYLTREFISGSHHHYGGIRIAVAY